MKGNILLISLLVLFVATACGGASPVDSGAPAVPPLLLADFTSCSGTNSLGGAVGAAYALPDLLVESYEKGDDGGCYIRADFRIDQWAALWLKLPDVDLTPYQQLVFDIKTVSQPGMPQPTVVKIELKKANGEVSTVDVGNLSPEWQTRTVRLTDFGPSYGKPIRTWKDIAEFVVVVEQAKSGRAGTILLDNVLMQ